MFVIVELPEVRDLIEVVLRKREPDIPLESIHQDQKYFDDLSEMLDVYLNPDDKERVKELLEDEEILDKVSILVEFIVRCVILRGAIRWFRILDHHGGIAISVKPGEDSCSLQPISVVSPVSPSIQ